MKGVPRRVNSMCRHPEAGRSMLGMLKEEQRGWCGRSQLSKEETARGPESARDVSKGGGNIRWGHLAPL